jgi:hypothetical protein
VATTGENGQASGCHGAQQPVVQAQIDERAKHGLIGGKQPPMRRRHDNKQASNNNWTATHRQAATMGTGADNSTKRGTEANTYR